MPLELLGDRRRVAAQLVDHAAQPRLVVAAHPRAHGGGRLVAGRVEPGEPLLVLGALLQQRFDRCRQYPGSVWP